MYIDIRIHVDMETDPEFNEKIFDITKIDRTDTTVPKSAITGLQETLSQSDFGSIEFPQAIITALDGTPTTFKE